MKYKEKVTACSEIYIEHKANVITMYNSWMLNLVVRKVAGSFKRLTSR
jgi:hypothetical protein